jgi:hypothetical protein
MRAGAVQGGKAMRAAGGAKRTFIRPAYDLAKKVMPKISPTEEAALSSGTISWYIHFLKSLLYSDFKGSILFSAVTLNTLCPLCGIYISSKVFSTYYASAS